MDNILREIIIDIQVNYGLLTETLPGILQRERELDAINYWEEKLHEERENSGRLQEQRRVRMQYLQELQLQRCTAGLQTHGNYCGVRNLLQIMESPDRTARSARATPPAATASVRRCASGIREKTLILQTPYLQQKFSSAT